MDEASPTTIQISDGLRQRYDTLAEFTGRSPTALIMSALEQYVDAMLSEVMAIKDSIAEIEAGLGIPHEEVMARLLG